MGTVRYGEDKQHETRHEERGASPVHGRPSQLTGDGVVRWDGQIRRDSGDSRQDGADKEVPAPGEELAAEAREEDANEESEGGAGTVDAEDEVLAGSRAVGTSENHDARGEKSGEGEALQGAEDEQHEVVLREARDEGGEGQPGHAADVEHKTAIHVCQTAADEECRGDGEGQSRGGPDRERSGDIQLAEEGGEEHIGAGDVVFG